MCWSETPDVSLAAEPLHSLSVVSQRLDGLALDVAVLIDRDRLLKLIAPYHFLCRPSVYLG
jgi:hypothetical protein